MKKRDLNEEASRVISSVLNLADNPENFEHLYKLCHEKIIETIPLCKEFVDDCSTDEVLSLVKIYKKFVNRMMKRIVTMPEEPSIQTIFDMFLYCFKNEDLCLTDALTDYFTDVISKLMKTGDSANSAESVKYFMSYYKEKFFYPLIKESLRIIKLSQKHLRFFEDRNLDSDDDEHDKDFSNKNDDREQLKHLIREVSRITGFEDTMRLIAESMQTTLSYHVGQSNNLPLNTLCEFESELFAVYALMKRAKDNKNTHCEIIKEMLLFVLKQDCFNIVKLMQTVVLILKKSTPFFKHDKNVAVLAVQFLSRALQIPKLGEYAAESMSKLMKNNPNFVIENINDFMQLYTQKSDNDDIVEGMVLATNILDYNHETAELINKICSPFATKLVELLKLTMQRASNPQAHQIDKNVQSESGVYLTKIEEEILFENLVKMSIVIRNLNPVTENAEHHVLVEIFRDFWPLIEYMLKTYKNKSRFMEKVCKIVKHTMRCIKHLFLEFVETYFTIILTNYQEYPLPAYLYTVEVALTIFYKNQNLNHYLSNMFCNMVARTAKE